jgi:flagellar biosynthesis chaperone FliJ
MARDPLAVLRRMREAAVTEAQRNLAAALIREAQEARRLEQHHSTIRHEMSEAVGEYGAAFADWLPYARQHAETLQTTLAGEQARVVHLQEILTRRRTEAETVAKAMQRQHLEAELIRARKEQAALDEAASRRIARSGKE